jgi:hypothetical protein
MSLPTLKFTQWRSFTVTGEDMVPEQTRQRTEANEET